MPDELENESDNNLDANGMESVAEGNGENPAWQELYSILPDNLHTLVAPVLKKWEDGTAAKFKQHADSETSYEPYKQFIDNGIEASQIEQALSVAQLIDSDPKAFMEQMRTFFGETEAETPPVEKDESEGFTEQEFDLKNDPNFKKLTEQQDVIAGFLSKQVEAENAAKEDAQLESELTALATKFGEFDEDYVFGLALNNVPLEDAVKKYHTTVEGIRSKPAPDANLPNILTPGGGLPSEQVNPAEMTDQQRKAFVMNVLANANKTT